MSLLSLQNFLANTRLFLLEFPTTLNYRVIQATHHAFYFQMFTGSEPQLSPPWHWKINFFVDYNCQGLNTLKHLPFILWIYTFDNYFFTAFLEFFRMCELVQNTKQDVGHAIQVQNVSYSILNNTVKIVLQHSVWSGG